ncbi:Imm1 family immunity protein [Sorangium sp. So ce269]
MFVVEWNQQRKHLSSALDVERLLDELHAVFLQTDPTLVTVELSESGDSLAIGLGRERSVLNFVSGNKNPPYFTSKGEIDIDEGVAFRFAEDWSEFPMRNSVPTPVAREAIRHFCDRGGLAESIEWEQD